jgi:sensor histidine kinase YesM
LSPAPALRVVLSSALDLLAYGALLGLTHSVLFYRRFREREHRAMTLESNLANARLNALRAQLQPHFLFNSLNAIAALLRRDPRLAEATLMSLSDLLRLALSQSEQRELPLREELHFIERYFEIQRTRFGEQLRFEQDIEPAALDCLVPTLLFQPLVENAIRHGIEPAGNAGTVRLSAHHQNGNLLLTVEDDGVGLDPVTAALLMGDGAAKPPAGIGLKNLRARLETLYGPRQTFELAPRPVRGVVVRIEIPWRPLASGETPGDSKNL